LEPEIAALASTAGTTVVTLMATDAWQRTREGIAALWQRVLPERVDTVTAELDATREDLAAAQSDGDEEVVHELQAEWQGRIRRLLVSRPEVAEELRLLLDELGGGRDSATGTTITQHATASGQSRIYQAGRDQRIGDR